MNNSLSIIHLITEASLLVQVVMLILLAASLMSWFIIFQRRQITKNATKDLQRFESQFWGGQDLSKLYRQLHNDTEISGAGAIFVAGFKEFNRLHQQGDVEPQVILDASQRAMRIAFAKEEDSLSNHLPILATIGSTSPYIGLFGTVWGIMHSFVGLANVQQASIATVAPGIAEALIATAMGLFAAIPAVIAYNRFSAKVDRLLTAYDTFGDEFSSILHRTLHVKSKQREAA